MHQNALREFDDSVAWVADRWQDRVRVQGSEFSGSRGSGFEVEGLGLRGLTDEE
jgi:hypothetical protein